MAASTSSAARRRSSTTKPPARDDPPHVGPGRRGVRPSQQGRTPVTRDGDDGSSTTRSARVPTSIEPMSGAPAATAPAGRRHRRGRPAAATVPTPASGGERVRREAHRHPEVEVVGGGRTIGAEGDRHTGREELGDVGEPAGQLLVRRRAVGDRRAGGRHQRDVDVRQVHGVTEHRARAKQTRVAEHLDGRAAVTLGHQPHLASVSPAWTWTRAPSSAASSPR